MAENTIIKVESSEIEKIKSVNKLLIILLVITSFFLGSLTNKISSLQKASDQTTGKESPQAATTISETFALYAKKAGLDEKKFISCFNSGRYKKNISDNLNEGEKLGVQGTPAFFINGKFLGGAFPLESFKEIIDKELNGTSSTDYLDYSNPLQNAYANKAFDPEPKTVDIGNAPIQGSKDAKITLVEFSDFQCPFCERAFPTIQQLMKDYKGKIKIAYKQFPLTSIHPNAQKSAEASECANEQGKFWEYHDLLFTNQNAWSPLAPLTN